MSDTITVKLTKDKARLVLGILNHAACEGDRRGEEGIPDPDNTVATVREIAKQIEEAW